MSGTMTLVLKPCRVPWCVGASMSGVTLIHAEEDAPECSVVFGGGRIRADGLVDNRRIEIVFSSAYYARASYRSDDRDLEAEIDCRIEGGEPASDSPAQYLAWIRQAWPVGGLCPIPGFYVATQSSWLESVKPRWSHLELRHYLIDGRDGYVEVLATGFQWREWVWTGGQRDALSDSNLVAAYGEGVE